MESTDVAAVLQEAGDADSRARTRSQVWVEYNIIPYTSTSITLLHLCQEYHDHYIVISSNGRMGRLGGGSFMLGFGWGTVCGYHIFSIFFFFMLLVIVLSWLVHDGLLCLFNCSFFAFFVCDPFNKALLVHGNCCVCCVKLFEKSGSWLLLCRFPWKGESALISITL